MPRNENDLKWACAYCTYMNWPSTIKCTLCRAPKPPDVITHKARKAKTISEDIYEAAGSEKIISSDPLICPPSSKNNQNTRGASIKEQETNKWICTACTFENWIKSVHCVMCRAPRTRQYRNGNHGEASAAKKAEKVKALSPRSSHSHLHDNQDSKAINNERNKVILKKWICPSCTYENWPKAASCVLCNNVKATPAPKQSLAKQDEDRVTAGNNSPRQPSASRFRFPPTEDNKTTVEIEQSNRIKEKLIYDIPASDDVNDNEEVLQIRNCLKDPDWMWLSACIGVAEGDAISIESYLSSGGDISRQLTREDCLVLNRPGSFEVGYTLVHLALKFKHDDLLAIMLAPQVVSQGKRRVPCLACPDLAGDIRRNIAHTMRQRKGDWPCYFFTDQITFALPAEIQDFPGRIRRQVFDDILDKEVQQVLESKESPVINWSSEITDQLGSRIYPLWNRSAGDCLLDSILQATYGVFDRDNTLRKALYESLSEGASRFFPRYKEWESIQAENLQYTLDEDQWDQDWASILSLASQPGTSLEQTHVFALAHILRRPIIIYGVKYVKSFRGETLGLARFQGVYLPLLWERSFCWKDPVVLGYTRGHFSALVAMETDTSHEIGAGAHVPSTDNIHETYLPLVDHEGRVLTVHFLLQSELDSDERLLREWLDCCVTDGGVLVARQRNGPRPALVNQLIDDWLDRYRKLNKTK